MRDDCRSRRLAKATMVEVMTKLTIHREQEFFNLLLEKDVLGIAPKQEIKKLDMFEVSSFVCLTHY